MIELLPGIRYSSRRKPTTPARLHPPDHGRRRRGRATARPIRETEAWKRNPLVTAWLVNATAALRRRSGVAHRPEERAPLGEACRRSHDFLKISGVERAWLSMSSAPARLRIWFFFFSFVRRSNTLVTKKFVEFYRSKFEQPAGPICKNLSAALT